MAAGSALVAAMATDAWQQARDGVVALWRRIHPERAEQVGGELEALRTQVLQARHDHDPDTEQALEGMWRLQLQALLQQDPTAADGLRRLLDDQLGPALNPGERERVYSVFQNTTVHGGTSIVAGRDVYREPPAPKV
ncbi:hypothetical protein [Streptomyces sp. NBC_01481]|uniref:hypothetical protein n=1 Tax=Streptomyces sp. NBC_01481 TaxID=2975869 RepID=UPI0022590F89|nr:hypothetical protein [Streptomyces sp. NBC_01481]MCX4587719.1 hypothetical protein [Streptomyces sp. NBC_01481]